MMAQSMTGQYEFIYIFRLLIHLVGVFMVALDVAAIISNLKLMKIEFCILEFGYGKPYHTDCEHNFLFQIHDSLWNFKSMFILCPIFLHVFLLFPSFVFFYCWHFY